MRRKDIRESANRRDEIGGSEMHIVGQSDWPRRRSFAEVLRYAFGQGQDGVRIVDTAGRGRRVGF
jgi:hypothetical protein